MVLLIPQAVEKIMENGCAEGRAEQRNRREEVYNRFGVEVDGVLMLPNTPEVKEFLNKNGDSGE